MPHSPVHMQHIGNDCSGHSASEDRNNANDMDVDEGDVSGLSEGYDLRVSPQNHLITTHLTWKNASKTLKSPLKTHFFRSLGISTTPIFSLLRLIPVSIFQGWGSSDYHSVNATPKRLFPMPLYLLLDTGNEQLLIKLFVIRGRSNLIELPLAILNGRNTSTA